MGLYESRESVSAVECVLVCDGGDCELGVSGCDGDRRQAGSMSVGVEWDIVTI